MTIGINPLRIWLTEPSSAFPLVLLGFRNPRKLPLILTRSRRFGFGNWGIINNPSLGFLVFGRSFPIGNARLLESGFRVRLGALVGLLTGDGLRLFFLVDREERRLRLPTYLGDQFIDGFAGDQAIDEVSEGPLVTRDSLAQDRSPVAVGRHRQFDLSINLLLCDVDAAVGDIFGKG